MPEANNDQERIDALTIRYIDQMLEPDYFHGIQPLGQYQDEGIGSERVWEYVKEKVKPDMTLAFTGDGLKNGGDREDGLRNFYKTETPGVYIWETYSPRLERPLARKLIKVGPENDQEWQKRLVPRSST